MATLTSDAQEEAPQKTTPLPNSQKAPTAVTPKTRNTSAEHYTASNLEQHPLPDWFDDAKFGIIIHFGLYSVPGWAPNKGQFGSSDFKNLRDMLRNMPYSEWYYNSLKIPNSETHLRHHEKYGDAGYMDFVEPFNTALKQWDATEWADFMFQTGSKYCVLTTKHHDGYLLWPSKIKNPHRTATQSILSKDVVGELTAAVRDKGMKMGLYYSGGIDWSFEHNPMRPDIPKSKRYASYVDAHIRELIDLYQPSLLWNDIGYPKNSRLRELIAYYFNTCEDALINDRFNVPLSKSSVSGKQRKLFQKHTRQGAPVALWFDFFTPEYKIEKYTEMKWETVRGVGNSFGYNQNEPTQNYLTFPKLLDLLLKVVSNNGNLLVGIGPMANGTIPEVQKKPLLELGSWLNKHGQCIYGTRPLPSVQSVHAYVLPTDVGSEKNTKRHAKKKAGGNKKEKPAAGLPVYFTVAKSADVLHMIFQTDKATVDIPQQGATMMIPKLSLPGSTLHILCNHSYSVVPVVVKGVKDGVTVAFTAAMAKAEPFCMRCSWPRI